ncbi:MAG: hypothetical protein EOP85_19950 [Verrucomicrobiaceae bacterium]|nr:MAG: hypothetical protein EOP85_19950 [Verrucomicrobiaceae bacterium]
MIGTSSAVLFHGFSFATGNALGSKGGWLTSVGLSPESLVEFPKEMSQTFWVAIVAFSVTFIVNAGLSLASKRDKTDEELKGLVYSLTPKFREEGEAWILRPAVLGSIVFICAIILNIIFW